MSGLDIPLEGKGIRQLCGTVLGMEAVVIGLAILPAIVLSGLVGRPRMGWVLPAGSVFQFLVIASGVFVPAMYVLGVIFAALWVTGIWLARRHTPRRGAS